ncbi:MAG: hydrolase 1, exosortase A system-associated, partial [Sutterellaceae bacterium]|nr:hydrolase 1, exosortase A system-associated [Burkholderiaceae bacterium]MDW8429183.1 hydrolase 1, exosortase A system-associated [Sutterellaceae bacterium]
SALDVGVIVVVGGPQYRVGSHRQFVLLARAMARHGIACLRFDYRGMGDSSGGQRTFEDVDADIACAVATLLAHVPSVRRVVLWGLCDGASAALMAARAQPHLAGIVALNPWVRDQATLDRALLKHYYGQRLLSAQFWRKALSGGLDFRGAFGEFAARVRRRLSPKSTGDSAQRPSHFQERMRKGLERLPGPMLLILSGRDLTAREFESFTAGDRRWRSLINDASRVRVRRLPAADHTFSDAASRAEVERHTIDFVLSIAGRSAAAPAPPEDPR